MLLHATKTLDIGLIRDDAKLTAPWREPQAEVPFLGDDLAADVVQMLEDDSTIPATIVDTQTPPSLTASQALSSSRATPFSRSFSIPVAQVQKMEVQMATLLQHVKPLMHRSIAESEARMERMIDQKVQFIHKRLDAFEERVLERPALTIDVTTFQGELASLRVDVPSLLAPQRLSQSLPLWH